MEIKRSGSQPSAKAVEWLEHVGAEQYDGRSDAG